MVITCIKLVSLSWNSIIYSACQNTSMKPFFFFLLNKELPPSLYLSSYLSFPSSLIPPHLLNLLSAILCISQLHYHQVSAVLFVLSFPTFSIMPYHFSFSLSHSTVSVMWSFNYGILPLTFLVSFIQLYSTYAR